MNDKHVIDTHALIWYLEGNARLGRLARAIISNPDSDLVLPAIALAEAMFIVERGWTSIPTVQDLLAEVQADSRISVYPLTWGLLQRSLSARTIPELHDRLIVATALDVQAIGHPVTLPSRDETIVRAGLVRTAW